MTKAIFLSEFSLTFTNPHASVQMCKLAAVKINSMAERLKLLPQLREKIYLLFQQILTQKVSLFFNRRIEQIILCCFYLVVRKVRALLPLEDTVKYFLILYQFILKKEIVQFSPLQLTFQEIAQNYVKETQCRSQDFCWVFVSWSSHCNRVCLYIHNFFFSSFPGTLQIHDVN